MNVHQPILPTNTTVVPNVSVLRTQATNPSIDHTKLQTLMGIEKPINTSRSQTLQPPPLWVHMLNNL
jgi:hypothetical protein